MTLFIKRFYVKGSKQSFAEHPHWVVVSHPACFKARHRVPTGCNSRALLDVDVKAVITVNILKQATRYTPTPTTRILRFSNLLIATQHFWYMSLIVTYTIYNTRDVLFVGSEIGFTIT